ncbi:MAG TPA: MFS transporter [Ktedonobacterales bacterium]|nr:MFS transporter [Ktedonobacterales bacterium]
MSLDAKRTRSTQSIELWTLVGTILASSMAFIDSSALNVVLSNLQSDFGASGAQLLWIVNAYLLMLAALILTGGALGDRFGRKRIFSMGIALFAVASLACGLAPTIELLLVGRVIQGIGGALMVPGSLAIITATFKRRRRGWAIGIWSAASTLTTMAGPAIGGVFASLGVWRLVFFINVPLAVVALFALMHVPETRDEEATGRFDIWGTLLVVLGLFGVTFGAIGLGNRAGAEGANPLDVLSLVGGVVALALFIVVEMRSAHPMMPLSIFRSRTFVGTNVMCVFLYGALSGTLFFFPLNLIQIQGYNPALAGLATLPFSIVLAILSPMMGRMADRVGPRLLLTVGPSVVALGFVLLALPGITSGPVAYWWTYFPGILVIGAGMGITVAPLTTAVMSSAPTEHSGLASGVNNAVTRSAQVLALAILGAVAIFTFSSALQTRADTLALSPQQRATLVADAGKLGETPPPPGLDQQTASEVTTAVQESFVNTFRLLSIISACMALLSGALAWLLVGSSRQIQQEAASLPDASQVPTKGAQAD